MKPEITTGLCCANHRGLQSGISLDKLAASVEQMNSNVQKIVIQLDKLQTKVDGMADAFGYEA